MKNGVHVMSWVRPEVKERFGALARAQALSESGYLRQVIHSLIRTANVSSDQVLIPAASLPKDLRIAVRLRPEDHRLLRERASLRSMPVGAYVAVLVRAYLHQVVPIPTAELDALKESIAELSAIGRNLNQIAHALNRDVDSEGPSRQLLRDMLNALIEHRDRIKALIVRNRESWEMGHEKARS
jgi:hypothetical protein